MKINLKSVFFFLLLAGITSFIQAQKVMDQGMIKMEITKVTADDPQMAMQLDMLKGSQSDIYFTKDKSALYMSMMGGMLEIKNFSDFSDGKQNMLMDMMGQKIWVETTEAERMNAQQKQVADKTVVTIDKNDTKKIQGFNCYKFSISNPEMEDFGISGYATDELKLNPKILQGFESAKMEGFPLEYIVGNKMFGMTMTAVSVKDTVDAKKLQFDTKGYKKMTMEELAKMTGGMGGFGF
ncbi:MAG: hypothetical protein IPM26_15775 [Saprospiraceae bacterium]|nr:hypothetical protein [Saprospiraceae bacterium]